MDPARFEQLVRAELALRDQRRQGRLFHPDQRAEADEQFVQAVMDAAGMGGPADGGKALRQARRGQRLDYERAFGDD